MDVNSDSLLIRAATTSTSGTLNDLRTDLIMANNHNTSGGYPILPIVVRQPASLTSSAVIPAGSVHKSRGEKVVRMWVQFTRCVCADASM